ncbi:SPOR domain-containing protein [Erythrobacter sp. KY5]|uniref:SPOR domain-containing protein n=1 Tax=Erythrobacter sp. KY5 TaxID=2011159 RepID=UPI000DBF034E|nr:SPOR domain-containing protein [Erythrobacter sp. KY5]AWW73952.1 SPOR domain-containing protein [Erythrobacter sp. KY5]
MIEAEYEEIEDGTDQLDLSDDDSLPWLEAEEEDDAAGGVDTRQVVGFALFMLFLLVVIVGSFWYLGGRQSGGEQVADGSIIAAPDTPIKERPEDPGGKEFDGTGNVAPVVGEGGTSEGVMATQEPAATAGGADGENARQAFATTSGVGVQLAAYSSRARAEQGWNDITRRTDALSGFRYRIEEGVVDIGTVYRLQAVAGDRAAGDALCAALKADGIDCQVKP